MVVDEWVVVQMTGGPCARFSPEVMRPSQSTSRAPSTSSDVRALAFVTISHLGLAALRVVVACGGQIVVVEAERGDAVVTHRRSRGPRHLLLRRRRVEMRAELP